MCDLLTGIKAIGYVDICSFLIDCFMVFLAFVDLPYTGWTVLTIFQRIIVVAAVSGPRLGWFIWLYKTCYLPGKSKQCAFVRLATLGVNAITFILVFIRTIADDDHEGFGLGKGANVVIEILIFIGIVVFNLYFAFLFFIYGKKGQPLYEHHKKQLERRKEIRERNIASQNLDQFGMPVGAASQNPIGAQDDPLADIAPGGVNAQQQEQADI